MLLTKSYIINANKYFLAVETKFPVDSNIYVTTRSNMPLVALTMQYSDNFSACYLNDLFVIDNFGKTYRFVVVYRFTDLDNVLSYTIMTASIEGIAVFSIDSIYESAAWAEREAWEMFGVSFDGNQQMRRLLTDYGFRGFPLRKDFPLSGYKELFFSYHQNMLEFVNNEFMQKYRRFEFYHNWK